jgi:geranylgeranyl diphosphate synthase, type I
LGDIGFFLAIKLLAKTEISDSIKCKAINSFIDTLINTGLGEMLDVELPYVKPIDLHTDDYDNIMRVYKYKTARYTITGPLQLGSILANANNEVLNNIIVFGDNLGIAFQIKDDLIGIFSSEAKIGKSVTSDIEEGKKTLLYNYAMLNASDEDRLYLKQYYGNGKIDNTVHENIKRIFIDCGAKLYCENQLVEFAERAKQQIVKITDKEKYIDLLFGLADFMIERVK